MNQTTHRFHISGTHCASCKIFIEDTLKESDDIRSARVDLEKETLEVEVSENRTPEVLAKLLTEKIESNGYAVSVEKPKKETQAVGVLWRAVPIGLGVLALFFLLQKSGILDTGIGGRVTPVTSFLIGLVASVSSCLAVVGGLVLSFSAKVSAENSGGTKTFALFHLGRLASFALLGGALGAIGGAFGVDPVLSGVLGLLASLVMLILGLNLIGVFKKNSVTVSPRIFTFLRRIERGTLAPLVLGFATFFLPCGFTQSMQVSALSAGSFLSGFLIMLFFALGTLPMLAFLSFGSASFARGKYAPVFFKSAGVVVIGLGLFSLLSGLAGLGIINPLFSL